jgi:hypothetical protein
MVLIEHHNFDQILKSLTGLGYEVVGPTIRDGAIPTWRRLAQVMHVTAAKID